MELPPRNILADTGPLFALIHAGDADHARAVEFARSFTGRLITTWPVLTEVAYRTRTRRAFTNHFPERT